jgi:hypothetical protein
MTQTIKNNRDKNEREIIEVLRRVGCVVWQMDRKAGFDLLVIAPSDGGVEIVEVKNPARKWTLTEDEKKKKAEVESVNGVYWIIEDIEDALNVAYHVR